MPLVSSEFVLDMIRKKVAEAGGQANFARMKGITPQMLNDTLRGRVDLGATVAATVRAVAPRLWSVPDEVPSHPPVTANMREHMPVLAPQPIPPAPAIAAPDSTPAPEHVALSPALPETCGACANFQDGMCAARDFETTADTPWCALFELQHP